MIPTILAILAQGCSTDPSFPPPVISCSSPAIGNPWFLTYSGVPNGGTGGTADCCVMIGMAAPDAPPCSTIQPVATLAHWMPLRGNPVVVVMPAVPNDPAIRGLDVSVQAIVVGHLPGRPEPVALTNVSGFRIL